MTSEPLPHPVPAPPLRLLITPREAARAISVCERTLWNLTRRGELPAVRIGRAVRYHLEDLKAFVARRKGVGYE